MRIRRDASDRGPYLEWRVRLLGAGAIVALVGFWADAGWLLNVAIVLLLLGFALRFAGSRHVDEAETGEDEDTPDVGNASDDGSDASRR